MKKLYVFDLDGTLARSKCRLDDDMALLLTKLLEHKLVAVISGCRFEQFLEQLIVPLTTHCADMSKLCLLPTSGAACYVNVTGDWQPFYALDLGAEGLGRVKAAFDAAWNAASFERPNEMWGPQFEDRGSQATFSALGQLAPIDAKFAWDPTGKKRHELHCLVSERLAGYGFDVKIGGSTSIDVTRRGIDKAFGINQLKRLLDVADDEVVFIGDALFPGGNDNVVVTKTAVQTISVRSVDETRACIMQALRSTDEDS